MNDKLEMKSIAGDYSTTKHLSVYQPINQYDQYFMVTVKVIITKIETSSKRWGEKSAWAKKQEKEIKNSLVNNMALFHDFLALHLP